MYVFFFFFEQKLFYLQLIYFKKHVLRETSYLPNHTCYAAAVNLRRKLAFTSIFLALLTNQFDAFFNPNNASEMNATNSASPT